MSRYTKANHRILMQFIRRDVWHVTFLELGTANATPPDVLLLGVMTIAEKVDSQLSQAMKSYIAESIQDALPT